MRPPGFEDLESWEEMSAWQQAKILAFFQIESYEKQEEFNNMLKISAMRPIM